MTTGRPRVVVIGGGLAGISAALDCAQGGAQVTLLERQQRLGGATWSFRRNGVWFDNGHHVFLRCCTAYRDLLVRLGVAHLVRLQDRLDLPVLQPARAPARLTRNGLPPPLHLGSSLLRYRHLRPAQRLRLARAALALRRLDRSDPALDDASFGTWLAARGQSPEAVTRLWDLICRPTVNLPADESSLAVAATVFQIGLLETNDGADIGWSRVPLGRLHGEAGRTALDAAGCDVRVGAAATSVEADGNGGFRVRVDGADDTADAVVLAVPHDKAARLAPAGVAGSGRLEELGWSPIVNVGVVYDRAVTDLPFAAAIGTPVQFVADRTEAAGLEEGQCLTVSLSAADEHVATAPDVLLDRFTTALAELFPAARSARVIDAVVTKERAATFRATPGSARLRLASRTPLAGLALAGAWTDTGWPATMEGAVRSGRAAAAVALTAVGHTRSVSKEALGCP
jgi:squalene-associated FAD-dependent desaturase